MGPVLKFSRSLWMVFHPSSESTLLLNFGVLCKLAKDTVDLFVNIINKDIKLY